MLYGSYAMLYILRVFGTIILFFIKYNPPGYDLLSQYGYSWSWTCSSRGDGYRFSD